MGVIHDDLAMMVVSQFDQMYKEYLDEKGLLDDPPIKLEFLDLTEEAIANHKTLNRVTQLIVLHHIQLEKVVALREYVDILKKALNL